MEPVASCTTLPLVPRTVNGASVAGAPAVALSVSRDTVPGTTDGGENEALTPGGRSGTERATGASNPLVVETCTLKLTEPPGFTTAVGGVTPTRKSRRNVTVVVAMVSASDRSST